ncbi:MAG: hypothetical protein GY866_06115 [Proteobacteria bacterium]|nr:hypothetical protein [Pseudomonadota bacterium]
MVLSAIKKSAGKKIKQQTIADKMYLLKLIAHQILGQKWIFYKKIRSAGKQGRFFKSKSLTDQMKATQSALRFSTKNATKLYHLAYESSVKEIKTYTGQKEGYPALPEEREDKFLPPLISKHDAVIISWTPVKFLGPTRQIREKGAASQRHTEGLITKLFFKVVGYYATPENWDPNKLTLYLKGINKDSTYQQVVQALDPLKRDLFNFSEHYELFKFGKASLRKDGAQDGDSFDDAFEEESFESQVRTLYWHGFIYQAMESFLFKYYLTLLTATPSPYAVRYLTLIFEPALRHAIEIKHLFQGSFDTDVSKKAFRTPFEKYMEEREGDALLKKIKTKKGVFEIYKYNLKLLDRSGIGFNLKGLPSEKSDWRKFATHQILGIDRFPLSVDPEKESEKNNPKKKPEKGDQDELKQLEEEKIQYDEELNDVEHQLSDLNAEQEELERAEQDDPPSIARRRLGLEKKTDEIKILKLEKEKTKLDGDQKRLEEEHEKYQEKQSNLVEEVKKLKDEEYMLKTSKESLLADRGELEENERKMNGQEKKLYDEGALLTKTIDELKEQKGDADTDEIINKEISEINKENKVIGEKKKKIEREKQKIFKMQEEYKNRVHKLEQDETKIRDDIIELEKKVDDETQRAQTLNGIQDRLAELHGQREKCDTDILFQKKRIKELVDEEAGLDGKEEKAKAEKTRIVEEMKKVDKNKQRLVKKVEEFSKKIDKLKQEANAKQAKADQQQNENQTLFDELNKFETRSFALMHIMSAMISCSKNGKAARGKILERFKERVLADRSLAEKQIAELRKTADKKVREMDRKVAKLKRMKQVGAAEDFQKDIVKYKQQVDGKCKTIVVDSKANALLQKKRLKRLFQEISAEKKHSDSLPAKILMRLLDTIEPQSDFTKDFKKFIAESIQQRYVKDIEPFYARLFEILDPTIFEKVAIIQSLAKSGGEGDVRLSLTESEEQSFGTIVQNMKERIQKQMPDIFNYEIALSSTNVRIDDLFKASIDNLSLQKLFLVKATSSKNPTGVKIDPSLAKSLLSLNNVVNPIPSNTVILAGKENDANPLNAIDRSLLARLVAQHQSAAK